MNTPNDKWPPENPSPGDKWTAFWLSLVLPGAGHFWGVIRRFRQLAWLSILSRVVVGVGFAIAAAALTFAMAGWFPAWPWLASVPYLGLALSAAHLAKRLLEPRRRNPLRGSPTVDCGAICNRQVTARIELPFAEPVEQLWRRVSDLPAFLTIDPFHDRIALMRSEPKAGVDLVLSHNAFGHKLLRFGRIIRWSPGQGYAFSDLSSKGGRAGFPHVFFVHLTATGDSDCRLTIDIRGKWTSWIIPAWVGRYWIRWVCYEHARLLGQAL